MLRRIIGEAQVDEVGIASVCEVSQAAFPDLRVAIFELDEELVTISCYKVKRFWILSEELAEGFVD
jgi:hypothetical protein